MGAYKNHHFVPQFYLRNFSIDEKERQIGLFNILTEIFVRSTSIRSQAQRKKLYGNDEAEKSLSDLEGASARILNRIIQTNEVPEFGSADYSTLLLYVLFQLHRTPTAADELEEFQIMMIKQLMAMDEQVAPFVDEVEITVPNAVRDSLSNAAMHYGLITDLRCKMLVNRTETPLITSDHPVIVYNQFMERRKHVGSGGGMGTKGLQLFFPISPQIALTLYDNDVYRVGLNSLTATQTPATPEDVTALNLLQAINAGSQVFFGNAISEQKVRSIVQSAKPLRLQTRTSLKTHVQSNPDGTKTLQYHSSKTVLRIGLKLSNVVERPSVQGYRLGDKVIHRRNPLLCELHTEFVEKVEEGLYRASEFDRFLEDKEKGL